MNIKAVSEPCLRMSIFKKTFNDFAKAIIRNFVQKKC